MVKVETDMFPSPRSFLQILWTFSIFLESVAIMPQLFMITKTGEAESITTHYLFFLGLYRALYIANWVWRYHTEGFYDQIAIVSGVVQTIFYCDFFYLYVTRGEEIARLVQSPVSRGKKSAFSRFVVSFCSSPRKREDEPADAGLGFTSVPATVQRRGRILSPFPVAVL